MSSTKLRKLIGAEWHAREALLAIEVLIRDYDASRADEYAEAERCADALVKSLARMRREHTDS